MDRNLEVCLEGLASALAADAGGADRIELCDNLAEGGTTPSAGMISRVCELVSIPVFVMIRPRGGDFVYSPDEFEIMARDIDIAREAGLPYIYLGYWVPGSPKMGYKAKFSGLEAYVQGEWQSIKDPDEFAETAQHPLSSPPIAEQVANIQLPDRHPTKG